MTPLEMLGAIPVKYYALLVDEEITPTAIVEMLMDDVGHDDPRYAHVLDKAIGVWKAHIIDRYLMETESATSVWFTRFLGVPEGCTSAVRYLHTNNDPGDLDMLYQIVISLRPQLLIQPGIPQDVQSL